MTKIPEKFSTPDRFESLFARVPVVLLGFVYSTSPGLITPPMKAFLLRRSSGIFLLVVAAALELSVLPSAQAVGGNYTWKGGSGTWDLSSADWRSGASYYAWPDTVGAIIGGIGVPGTLTLENNIMVANNFGVLAAGYTVDLNGHALQLATGTLNDPYAFTLNFGSTTSLATFKGVAALSAELSIVDFTNTDTLRFGTTGSGLTTPELNNIDFVGYSDGGAAKIDSSGYVTPVGTAVPEPSSWALILGLVAICYVAIRRRSVAIV